MERKACAPTAALFATINGDDQCMVKSISKLCLMLLLLSIAATFVVQNTMAITAWALFASA